MTTAWGLSKLSLGPNNGYAWTGSVNVDRAYTINGLNQATASGAIALGYDARGNLTSSGATSYAYTSENLLQSTGSTALYYDPCCDFFRSTIPRGSAMTGSI
ncbi:hypothetical protein ACVWZA_001260 [Sphingomonas sp. UYAg733]